jgi:hypothetical protein
MAVRWFDACGRGAGSGSGPVGTHRLGNNDALPAVVTYFCPAGEVQMIVPSVGRVSQSTPLARFEPKDGDMTANRLCLQAIVAPTGAASP